METVIVPKLWPGETVVCIATGPSLTAEDVEYCRGKARVIAVNDAYRLAPWADVLYSSDRRWYPFHGWVPGFTGLKVAMELVHDGVITMKNTGDEGIEWSPDGLRTAMNSGGAAINLAVHFGAHRILLLGYDMGATGTTHFFGSHPSELSSNTAAHFKRYISYINTMYIPLRDKGIEVLNCTRRTALATFPRVPLESVL